MIKHIADGAEHIFLALGPTDFRNYEKYNVMGSDIARFY